MKLRLNIKYLELSILFLFVHSGLIKWLPFPIDPTLLFFSLTLFILFVRRDLKITVDPNTFTIFIWLVGFFALMGLSCLYTYSTGYWMEKLVRVYSNLVALILPFFFLKTVEEFKMYKKVYLLFTLLALCVLYWFYWSDSLRMILVSDEDSQVITRYPDYLSISFFLATAILLIQYEIGISGFLLFILAFLMIVILGGRGPLLFLIICLLIFYLQKITIRKITLLVSSFVLLVVIALNTSYFDRMVERMTSLINYSEDNSASERLVLIRESFKIIQDNPVLGTGLGGFSMAFNGKDERLSAHNIFLEITTEFGFIGLFSFLILLVIIVLRLSKNVDNNMLFFTLKMICLFYLFELMVSSILEDLRIPFFWLGTTLSMISNWKKNQAYVRN